MGKRYVGMGFADLSSQLAGLAVRELVQPNPESVEIHFANGAVLAIRAVDGGVSGVLTNPKASGRVKADRSQPTQRQREYLEFIKKFLHRFGVAPAETDIQRHFLVSAPSVNQMIRTLERRGFIVRDRDWFGQTLPRSIRVLWDG